MKEVTLYYANGCSWPFSNKEEALKCEKENEERIKRFIENSPKSKFDKLVNDLKNAMYVPEGTIVTCSYDAISIKGLVKVCQKFVEENKNYLEYY